MKKPLVTIVTVTYNLIDSGRRDYFKQCLESVHNQTYKTIEHIVIDGASSDGTLDLIKEYADKGWIKYISELDDGIYDAMNKGIKMAKGRYIAFLNSDDYYLHNEVIALSIKKLLESSSDFSFGDCKMLYEDKEVLFKGKIEEFLCHMPVPHPTMFVKTSVLRKEGGFNEKYNLPADYELLVRLVLEDYKSIYIENSFVGFRTDGATNDADYSDDIAQIYINNYSDFFEFKNVETAKDLYCKKEIPFGFSAGFEKYCEKKQLKNINIDKVTKYLLEQKNKLAKEKKVSQWIVTKKILKIFESRML